MCTLLSIGLSQVASNASYYKQPILASEIYMCINNMAIPCYTIPRLKSSFCLLNLNATQQYTHSGASIGLSLVVQNLLFVSNDLNELNYSLVW